VQVAADHPFGAESRRLRHHLAAQAQVGDQPVARESLEAILDAARWAPTAGNRHIQRFVATQDPAILRVLRMVSPGMIQRPTAAVVVCTDRGLAAEFGFPPGAAGLFVDVGTAAATILTR